MDTKGQAAQPGVAFDFDDRNRDTGAMASPDKVPVPTGLPPGFFERSDEERQQWIRDLKGSQPQDQTARETLLWIVDSKRDPRAVPALTEIMQRDPSIPIQRAAVAALRGTGDPAAIPGIIIGLRSGDRACCLSAILGCRQLKAREAVADLIALLNNTQRKEFRQIREHAADALVAIRDERAIQPLRAAATRGSPRSRRRLKRFADELASSLGY